MSLAGVSRAGASGQREGEEKEKEDEPGPCGSRHPYLWSSVHSRRARGYVGESGFKVGVKSPEDTIILALTGWFLSSLDP